MIRGGWGITFAPTADVSPTTGFSYTTSPSASVANAGTIPITTPNCTGNNCGMLSNPFPDGVLLPPGRSQGLLTNVGQSVSYIYAAACGSLSAQLLQRHSVRTAVPDRGGSFLQRQPHAQFAHVAEHEPGHGRAIHGKRFGADRNYGRESLRRPAAGFDTEWRDHDAATIAVAFPAVHRSHRNRHQHRNRAI